MVITNIKVGDKVKFLGVREFWFEDWIANAKKHLNRNDVYTVSFVQEASSSTGIKLAETGDAIYNHAWFEYAKI